MECGICYSILTPCTQSFVLHNHHNGYFIVKVFLATAIDIPEVFFSNTAEEITRKPSIEGIPPTMTLYDFTYFFSRYSWWCVGYTDS